MRQRLNLRGNLAPIMLRASTWQQEQQQELEQQQQYQRGTAPRTVNFAQTNSSETCAAGGQLPLVEVSGRASRSDHHPPQPHPPAPSSGEASITTRKAMRNRRRSSTVGHSEDETAGGGGRGAVGRLDRHVSLPANLSPSLGSKAALNECLMTNGAIQKVRGKGRAEDPEASGAKGAGESESAAQHSMAAGSGVSKQRPHDVLDPGAKKAGFISSLHQPGAHAVSAAAQTYPPRAVRPEALPETLREVSDLIAAADEVLAIPTGLASSWSPPRKGVGVASRRLPKHRHTVGAESDSDVAPGSSSPVHRTHHRSEHHPGGGGPWSHGTGVESPVGSPLRKSLPSLAGGATQGLKLPALLPGGRTPQ